jgi:hypothetical protein
MNQSHEVVRRIFAAVFLLLFSLSIKAQLTGIKTVGAGKTYTTLSAAINALNTSGVGIGGVIFDIDPGFTEVVSVAGGYVINTTTSTAANRILFRKAAGAGANPLITAATSNATAYDAVIKIVGTDYVTFDAIDLQENPANTNASTAAEFGYAFFYKTTFDGSTNDTIKNCTITMNNLSNATQVGAVGIYANTNHSSTGASTAISSAAGSQNFHSYYNNTIYNCAYGIAHIGVGGASPLFDNNTDVGGNTYALGNKIYVFGRTSLTTSPSGFPGSTQCGIMVSNARISNISYNLISGSSPVNNYGIYLRTNASTAPGTTHTSNIVYNRIIDTCTSNSSSYQLIGIFNDLGGTLHTLNINNNKLINFAATNTSFGGGVIGINSTAALQRLNILNDTFAYAVVAGASLTTTAAARSAAFKVTNTPSSVYVQSNWVKNLQFNNSGSGDITVLDVNGNYSSIAYLLGNVIDSVITTGTGSIYGYHNTGTPSGQFNAASNTFRNIYITGGSSTSSIRFINSNTGTSQSITVNANTIYKLGINGAVSSSGITGIYTANSNSQTILSNSIRNIYSSGTNNGIVVNGGAGHMVYQNIVDSLYSDAGSGANHIGIDVSPTGGSNRIYRNNVSNISSSTSTNASIYGIRAGGGVIVWVYNNMVGDLKLPAVTNNSGHALRGLSMGTPTTANVYNNTVYLNASSSGTDFSSAALAFAGTTNADVRNNILVNNSIPKGVGFSSAIACMAVGTAGTVTTRFLTTSNNNCLYAPTVANGVIYVEGQTTSSYTNAIQASCFDLGAYQSFMTGGRETASFSEIPPFLSTSTPIDLHLNTATASGCWNSGTSGVNVILNNDYDSVSRPQGASYDVGADEGLASSPAADKTPPSIVYSPIASFACLTSTTLTATITDASGVASGANAPRLYYKKSTSSDPNNNIATTNDNTVNGWKYVVASGSGPYSFSIDYSLLPGGFTTGDSMMYFVIAQDVSGNVGTVVASISPCPTNVQLTSAQTATAPPSINFFRFLPTYSGNYNIGGASPDFPNLTGVNGLFNAINSAYLSGDVTATIKGDIVEPGTITLNQWQEFNTGTCAVIGTPSYTLTIQSDGTQRVLSNTNLTTPLVNHNGADRVNYNGGSGAQRLLVFRNTHATAASCYPVMQFDNGCNRIKVNNCIIETNGVGSSNPTGSGIMWANATPASNNAVADFDTIINNDFNAASAGTTGVYRFGLVCQANPNLRLVVMGNNFVDFSYGGVMCFGAIADRWTISKNNFYQSGSYTSGATFTTVYGMQLGSSSASGHSIDSNYIGGRAPLAALVSGTGFVNSSMGSFTGISIDGGTSTATSIRGNVIKNIYLSGAAGSVTGISFSGNTNCYGNTIGDLFLPSIQVGTIGGTTSSCFATGISVIGANVSPCIVRKNSIGNIWSNTTNTSSITRLRGIVVGSASGSTVVVDSNVVVRLVSSAGFTGDIYTAANTAQNVICVVGILTTSTATGQEFKDNVVNLLRVGLSSQAFSPSAVAYCLDAGGGTFMRNFVGDVQNLATGTAASTPARIAGIRLLAGSWDLSNNAISLMNGSNTNQIKMSGILVGSTGTQTVNVYHNTVHISGTNSGSGAQGRSAAYSCTATSGTHTLRNNIFSNVRTGGTGKHYAIARESATTINSNFNDIYSTNAATQVLTSSGTVDLTFATWQATHDANSKNVKPVYVDAPNYNLHLDSTTNCELSSAGIPALGVSVDFENQTRNYVPDLGADEFNYNPKTKATIASSPVCEGAPFSITVSTNAPATLSYNWSVPSGITNPGNTNTFTTSASTLAHAGNYAVTVTDGNGCASSFDSVMVITPGPTVIASNDGSFCEGSNITLHALPNGATTYAWSGPLAYAVANSQDPTITAATSAMAGTYTVTVTDANGCSATATTAVVVNTPPTVSASNGGAVCVGGTIALHALPNGATTYAWSGPSAYTMANNQHPTQTGASTDMAGAYTVTVTDANGCSATASTSVVVNTCGPNTWLGVNTDWNDHLNWSTDTVPNSCAHNLVIPNLANDPIISTPINVGNIEIQNGAQLTLNSTLSICGTLTGGSSSNALVIGTSELRLVGTGAQQITGKINANTVRINNTSTGVTVAAAGDLSVNTALILQKGNFTNSGAVTLKSNATTTAYLDNFTSTTAGTYSGNLTVERYISNAANGYRDISSPVNAKVGGLADDFSIFGQNGVQCWYAYNPYPNVQVYNEALTIATGVYDEGFISYTGTVNALTAMKGVAVRTYTGAPFTLDLTGTPYTGNKSINITKTTSPTPSADGWNLIGNPYPSPVSWNSLKALNAGKTDGSYYVFHTTGEYTGNWGSHNGVTGVNGATNEIASMQGFYVKAASSTTFAANNASRLANETTAFFKTDGVQPDEIRLLLSNNVNSDEVVTYTDPNATANYDSGLDALKMSGGSTVYMSVKQGGQEMAINVIDVIHAQTELPLVLWASDTGAYTFSATALNLTTLIAYLKDATTNTLTDLRTNTPTLQLNGGQTYDGRYSIVFEDVKNTTGIVNTKESNIQIYAVEGNVIVQRSSNNNANITITNMLGQTVVETMAETTKTIIPVDNTNPWYAVVKVQEAGKVKVSKVLIR